MTDLKARLDIVRDKMAEEYTNDNFATLHSDHPFLIEQGKRLMADNHKAGFSVCMEILLPMVLEMRDLLVFYVNEYWDGRAITALDKVEKKIKELENE